MTYTPEKLWGLYQKLPAELRSLIFSAETAEKIGLICEKNSIKDSQAISTIANHVGYVLHGVLPPDEIQSVLEKEANLKNDVAGKITEDIIQIILSPVKPSLEKIYKTKIVSKKSAEKPEEKTEQLKKDTYREIVE